MPKRKQLSAEASLKLGCFAQAKITERFAQ